jgi:hypothetical protein
MTSIARIGVFAALALGINFPFLAIPNVEVISVTLFLSGLFLGLKHGLLSALIAGVIFVFFNPNGPQPIIIVGIAQILGFITFPITGGLLRRLILKKMTIQSNIIFMSVLGLILTLCYDVLTNLAFAVTIGPFWVVLWGGLTFALAHIISNAIIFGFTGAFIHKIWKRLEHSLPPLGS